MPIVIKELFGSDSITDLSNKLNFNFDQIILAGGGPPGIQGPAGPQGVPGPEGDRGDHWFVGLTAFGQTLDHDGINNLKVEDHFLDILGDVLAYFDNGLGSTGWTATGVNLMGPKGDTGNVGGSFEWKLNLGSFGPFATDSVGSYYGPTGLVSTVDNANINYIVPIGASKNGLFLGDIDRRISKLANFNSKSISPLTSEQNSPKLSIIQNGINSAGLNGLMIGAMGLTSSTGTLQSNFTFNTSGATVDAKLFYHAGFYAKFNSPNYQHAFKQTSFNSDFDIVANELNVIAPRIAKLSILGGEVEIAENKNFNLKSKSIRLYGATHNGNYDSIISLDAVVGNQADVLGQQYLRSFIIFQSKTVGGTGSVIIGATNSYIFDTKSALQISRSINTATSDDASLVFWNNSNTINSTTDYNAKFISSFDPTNKSFQISTKRLALNGVFSSNSADRLAQFPVHINQKWVDLPTTAGNTAIAGVDKWIFGIDSNNSSTSFSTSIGTGLGVVYYNSGSTGVFNSLDINSIGLQTYQTGATAGSYLAGKFNANLYSQIGEESIYGNFGIGFATNVNLGIGATAKLAVHGSVRIGNTATGYHNWSTIGPKYGLLIEGSINQGSTSVFELYKTSLQDYTATKKTIEFPTGSTPIYSIATKNRIFATSYIAGGTTNLYNGTQSSLDYYKEPHFSLPDLRTGMHLLNVAEGALVVGYTANISNYDVNKSKTVAKFTTVVDNEYAGPNSKIGSTDPSDAEYSRFTSDIFNSDYYNTANGASNSHYESFTVEKRLSLKPLYIDGNYMLDLYNKSIGVSGSSDLDGQYLLGKQLILPSTNSSLCFIGFGIKDDGKLWTENLSKRRSVMIAPGLYEGQILTITSLNRNPSAQIILNGNPQYGRQFSKTPAEVSPAYVSYSDYHVLGLDKNVKRTTGDYDSTIESERGLPNLNTGNYSNSLFEDFNASYFATDLKWNNDSGLNAPFQNFNHNISGGHDYVKLDSYHRRKFTRRGQFVICGAKTITLQWLPYYIEQAALGAANNQLTYKRVELSRQNLSFAQKNALI